MAAYLVVELELFSRAFLPAISGNGRFMTQDIRGYGVV